MREDFNQALEAAVVVEGELPAVLALAGMLRAERVEFVGKGFGRGRCVGWSGHRGGGGCRGHSGEVRRSERNDDAAAGS